MSIFKRATRIELQNGLELDQARLLLREPREIKQAAYGGLARKETR